MTDSELLTVFVRDRSPAAFESLVARYVDLVYATARRLVGDTHAAEDVTQAAFILLARKAPVVQSRSLPGWLVNVTRLSAREAIRSRTTREKHERQAATMRANNQETTDGPTAADIAPLLDHALSSLRERDRSMVVMRFLQGLGFAAIGQRMGVSEDAARKRTERALVKLRRILLKQDLPITAGGLTVVLAAHQAGTAPPAVLARLGSISRASPCSAIAQKVLAAMHWMKLKAVAASIALGTAAASAVTLALYHGHPLSPVLIAAPAPSAPTTHPAAVDLTTPEAAVRSVFAAVDRRDTAALLQCLYCHDAIDTRLAKAWASATISSARLNRQMVQHFGEEALLDAQGHRFIDADPVPAAEDPFTVEMADDQQSATVGSDTLGWARVLKTGDHWTVAIVQSYGSADQKAHVTPIIEAQGARMEALIADIDAGKVTDLATACSRKTAGCVGGRILLSHRAIALAPAAR